MTRVENAFLILIMASLLLYLIMLGGEGQDGDSPETSPCAEAGR